MLTKYLYRSGVAKQLKQHTHTLGLQEVGANKIATLQRIPALPSASKCGSPSLTDTGGRTGRLPALTDGSQQLYLGPCFR